MSFRGRTVLGVLVVVCCVLGVSAESGGARAAGGQRSGGGSAAPAGGESASGGLVLRSPAMPGTAALEEARQAADAARKRSNSPAAVAARAASRTRFEHLDAARAAVVAREAFPTIVEQPAGGPPRLPAGERITRYIAPNAARLALPGGRRAVIESTQPMAIETSPGHMAPVDLGLTRAGGVFESARPAVGVLIPQRLSDGVQLLEGGVSLTPVDAHGSPLAGSAGAVDGASVLYANTQRDADTLIKPTTDGFEADTLLRSVASPGQLYFQVGLPPGARLAQARMGQGPVQVVAHGAVIATVSPPSARDAAGAPVPVSMSLSGHVLVLTVADQSGAYQWPIEVDPGLNTVIDNRSANWLLHVSNLGQFSWRLDEGSMTQQSETTLVEPGEWMASQYETQGESQIYKFEGEVDEEILHGRSQIQFAHEVNGKDEGIVESSLLLGERGNFGRRPVSLCAHEGESPCQASAGHKHNLVWYKQIELEPAHYWKALYAQLWNVSVYISQEQKPELSYSTSEAVIDSGRQNVLYGSGGWLSPTNGAFEGTAHDPGIGISRYSVGGSGWIDQENIYAEGRCTGVQCGETRSMLVTWNSKMADGENNLTLFAENATGLSSSLEQKVKVDGTPPYNLEVSGWPSSGEISAAPHTLTVEATDGTEPTKSSGVGSISMSVDGGPKSPVPNVSCLSGPCTVSGKWTLNAEGLTEGMHRLTVSAIDNAGNEAATEFTFDVRHGTPVSAGPGNVDPTTGQFKLSATDVSLAGAGGVSRAYESRNLTAGAEGPLGPQWAIGLGGGQDLTVLPTGSVVLAGSEGGVTTFTLNEGKFESPPGDKNLLVEAKEKVSGKGITEYLLKDTVAGTATTFTQPEGTELTTPVYANQFGFDGAQLKSPTGVATDASGNVWVTDYLNGRVVKYSRAGTVLAAYGGPGPWSGQFQYPRDIAINQSTGNVYVVDEGNNRIVELKSSGSEIEAFGWGVTDGKAEFEICTSQCKAGIAGAGNGQLSGAKGVAVDSSGNVWVVDSNNNRIQEFTSGGAYKQTFGTEGSGEAQFKLPVGIAISGGYLYVADSGNNRVEKLSTAGKYEGQIKGASGSELNGPRGIAADPKTGNLYVVDYGNSRVQEFSSAGTPIAKFGSAGSGSGQFSEPRGVAVSPLGNVYVTDTNNNRVQEWMRPSWLPTLSEGQLKSGTTTYAYEAVEVEGKNVIEPTEALAPPPAKVSCGTKSSELKKGCRALTFKYATTTTATGVNPGQWGEYKGHLTSVSFHGWDPAKGSMSEPAVAQYEYDNKGRLRAEWDPRISPALKTIYGYDEEGHVVSVSPPGLQPWLLHYGTLAGDASTGRLLSVTHPAASSTTVLKERKATGAPANTAVPTLSSTTPVAGTTLSVSSNGTWSNSPLAYSYQWYDCQSTAWWEASKCSAILGATNKSYTPQIVDAGYRLVGQVTATNATGGTAAYTSTSNPISTTAPSYASLVFGHEGTGGGEMKLPSSVAVDGNGNVWVADYGNERIEEFSAAGVFIRAVGYGVSNGAESLQICTSGCRAGIGGSHNGQFNLPWGIAVNRSTGNVYVGNMGNAHVLVFNESGSYLRQFGSPGTGHGEFGPNPGVGGLAIDKQGNVWATDASHGRVEEFTSAGTYVTEFGSAGSGNGQLKQPLGIALSHGYVYVADNGNNRIQVFTATGAYVSQWGKAGSGPGEFGYVATVAADPISEDLYVSDCGYPRVQVFNPAGSYITSFGTTGSGNGQFLCAYGVALDSTGHIYVGDQANNRIEKWNPTYSTNNPVPAPPALESSSSVSTLEYRVPLTAGSGLQNMTEAEVAKWGQTEDVPVEAMAVFPPDKPMGWPAKEYERATVNYMDAQGRTVNVVSPSGAISTTEYNETNEVTRTLSPDNRVAAMNEGPSKSAEASKKLDVEKFYELGRLKETLGPEHTVRLAVGKEGKHNEEVQARDHVRYFYDENSPGGKTYGLVTKTIDGAQLANKEEFDQRTTVTAYGGQGELGWKLRAPTSVTTDPGGLNVTTTTVYNETTGNVVEAQSPVGSISDSHVVPVYSSQFGAFGTGNGQVKSPKGLALDGKGDVVIADEDNNRVEVFNEVGEFVKAFGTVGSGVGQLKEPRGVAVDPKGNIWVADTVNNRVEEFNEKGEFIRTFGFGVTNGETKFQICTTGCRAGLAGSGAGQLSGPKGIAVDSHNNAWVADTGNDRVEVYNEKGEYQKVVGSSGSGNGQLKAPCALAVAVSGSVWVADTGNSRVEVFREGGEYEKTVGSAGTGNGQLKEPRGITVDPHRDVWVADSENNRVEEFNERGEYQLQFGAAGTGNGQFKEPVGVQLDARGNFFIADAENNRIQKLGVSGGWESSGPPVYSSKFGSFGSGNGQMKSPKGLALDGKGNELTADEDNNRIDVFNEKGEFVRTFGFGVSNGEEKFQICTTGCRAGTAGGGTGQFKEPKGVAVDAKGNIWVVDTYNHRMEEFNESSGFIRTFGFGVSNGETKFQICTTGCRAGLSGSGAGQFTEPKSVAADSHNNVWVVDGGNNRVEEFNEKGEYLKTVGSLGNGNGQLKDPRAIAVATNGLVWVADTGNSRVEVFKENGEYERTVGSLGSGNGQFKEPKGITVDPNRNVWVSDSINNRVEEFNERGEYLLQVGSGGSGNGQFNNPWGIQIATNGNLFIADTENARIQKWTVPAKSNAEAHDGRTVYYSAEGESEVAACRNHPEWANLVCQTEPAAQPGTSGLPELPVTIFTYNVWDEVEKSTEAFGSTTRVKTQTYDPAGRALTSEETSTIDTALPKITNHYNEETGGLETQKDGTKTITSIDDTLGRLIKYTDADGSLTTSVYEEASDGRIMEVSIGGKGTQTYSYAPTTGFMTKLVDSAAGTFSATYDVEGKMLTEGFPNAMTATDTYDKAGNVTGIEYVKNTHCKTTCPETWFSDSVVPSIHGETLKQTSTLSEEPSYTYDAAGRLTQVQEIPAGKGCKTRAYAYDEESNRTGLTTSEPNSEGGCTSEGVLPTHSYDSPDRLIDPGVTYETFGNMTKLPASDAGEYELTSSYYVDGQVASQTQNGETIKYFFDPAGRTREAVSSGKTASTVVSHYAGPGAAAVWTSEGSTWTRNIPGIDGALDVIQKSGEAAVLQLHDLQGNIVGTAALSETETKLLSSYSSTEFGVPTTGSPPKYSWLGAGGVSSDLSSSSGSGVATQNGASYVPQVALNLQTAPVVPPGAFPNGKGTGEQYVAEISGWSTALANSQAAEVVAEYIARQEAERHALEQQELCEANPYACVELQDPIHHYRAWEAKEKAEKIWKILREVHGADLLSALGATAAELFVGGVVGFVTEAVAVGWFEDLAAKLEFCAHTLHQEKDAHGGCRLSYTGVLGTHVPYFYDKPVVSFCLKMSSDTVHVHECTLEVDKSETIFGSGLPVG